MNYRDIEQWDEDNLIQLPTNETDLYEYKSSKTDLKSLKKKISAAASAFWNSGGGIFIAGVDDNGKTDGGIPKIIGNQSARDWADQVIASVEPLGDYAIKMIKNHRKPSDIQSEHVVLVIAFEKSFVGPHMASDKKYYIRAGAHTGAAGHFLVEAIRARRNLEKPLLIGIIKPHSRKAFTLELEILAANDAPAFDVALDFSPLPLAFQKHAKDRFPIHISVIDKTHPFSMEISLWGPNRKETFGEDPVEMKLKYKDNIGKEYQHVQVLDIREGVGPMRFGDETIEKIEKSIDKLQSEMKWFRQDFNRFVTSNSKSKK